MIKKSLENRINRLEKVINESENFGDWSRDNLGSILDEVDDLLTDAIATADDLADSVASRELERALAIVRKVARSM